MPFVVPPSTRGKKPEKPLWKIALTRLGDTIAGRGLENFRIEYDLKQEAEESLVMQPRDRNTSNSSSTTTTVNIEPEHIRSNPENNDTVCCLPPPGGDGDLEERVVINKYGAHFVWIPTLGRYIARADRKTVRASAISSRLCFLAQCLVVLIGFYALLVRSVDCLGPAPFFNNNNNAPSTATTTITPGMSQQQKGASSSTSSSSSTHHSARPLRTIHPGWDQITQERSGLYIFFFFCLAIGGSVFQFFLTQSGDKSLGNPGYLSIEGDDQVHFELKGEFQNCVADCSIPQELRKACRTCGSPQALRCRHCKSCGRCVPRNDHHCFWLGHCVGSYDYGSFVLCIATMAMMSSVGLDLLFGSWVNVWHDNCGVPDEPDAGYFSRQWNANGFTFFFIVLVLFATVALWLLTGTHIAVTASEMTTYEFARPGKNQHMRYYSAVPSLGIPRVKGISKSFVNSPFSEAWYRNFLNLWWHYGTRSMYNRFGVGSKWHISALPAVRCGSIDGINYFVSGTLSSSGRSNNNNNNASGDDDNNRINAEEDASMV